MLTHPMLKVLTFVADYARAHGGVTPTYEEIKDGCGFGAKSGPHRVVDLLCRRGFLERGGPGARSLRVLKLPTVPTSAVDAERERCAKIAERIAEQYRNVEITANLVAREIAAAIRSVAPDGKDVQQ